MFRAVIFDFDGVITDSEVLHFRSFNQVLAFYEYRISKEQYYRDYLGLTDADLFKALVDEGALEVDQQQLEALLEKKKVVFKKLASSEGSIITGVREFLDMLRKNDIAIGIYSGALAAEIELILNDAELRDYFEVIVAADHVTEGKPDPEGFLLAMDELNKKRSDAILPRECIVVEDAHWGLEGAKVAGMHTIAVTNSYHADDLAMSEMVVDNLSELSIDDLHQLCG